MVLWKCGEAFLPLIIIILHPHLKEKLFQNYQTIKNIFLRNFGLCCDLWAPIVRYASIVELFQLIVWCLYFSVYHGNFNFNANFNRKSKSEVIWIHYIQPNRPIQMNKSINHVTVSLTIHTIESIDAAPIATNPKKKTFEFELNQLLSWFNWLSPKKKKKKIGNDSRLRLMKFYYR